MRFCRNPVARGLVSVVVMSMAIFTTATSLAAPASPQRSASQRTSKSAQALPRVVFDKIESTSLAGNSAGESTTRSLSIYLPPSYYTQPDRRFPVIYFLHGYGDRASIARNASELDAVMASKGMQEFIVIEPSCSNSFYANSPISGNWEDFIVKDLVAWADTHLRTIAKPAARGIGGFSMGGFGAINLALRHPDVFQATYAVAPGLVDNSALEAMKESWGSSLIAADYAAAFAPDPANPKQSQIPSFNGTPEDDAIIHKWQDGFGNLEKKIKAYKALNKPLAGIALQVGSSEEYAWLLQGTLLFDQLLNREGIAHRFELTSDYHTLRDEVASTRIIPFFSLYLEGRRQ